MNTLAAKIIKSVKAIINESKKKNPTDTEYFVYINTDTCFNKKTNKWDLYSIRIYGGTKFAENLTEADMYTLGSILATELNKLKKTKGWGNLLVKWEKETVFLGSWRGERTLFEYPSEITLVADPCKEFKSLANYVQKYVGLTLNPFEVWNGHIGGKRGRVYGDAEDLHYLCHRPKKCEKILAELRKVRGTNDKCSFAWKKEDEIDPWDLAVSIRNEVEFDGIRRNFVEVAITTPTGRQKGVVKIAA